MSRIDQIIAAFDKLVDLRGKHVHKKRYTDEDFDSQALKSKSEWIALLRSNNSSIQQLLDEFFHEIYKLTFIESGEWVGFMQRRSSS